MSYTAGRFSHLTHIQSSKIFLQAPKLTPTGAPDETRLYEYEGTNESRCTSLSSLNSSSSDVQTDYADWEDSFRALGPKFHKLADLAGGRLQDEEEDSGQEDSSVSDGGGTEI